MVERSVRPRLEGLLAAARARTLALIRPLTEAQTRKRPAPELGPILWDLGHVAAFEAAWLLGRAGERRLPAAFDPFARPRARRSAEELPGLRETLDEMERVRSEVLSRSRDGRLPLGSAEERFLVRMVAQHEGQHQETILQSIDALASSGERTGPPPLPPLPRLARAGADEDRLTFGGGRVVVGTGDREWSYDNERPAHEVELRPFRLDRFPVTNRRYREFVEAGGYRRRDLWSEDGWRAKEDEGWTAPLGWVDDRRGPGVVRFGRREPLDPACPVERISLFEAEAFARWCRARLPTEEEWEAAARGACGALPVAGGLYEWTASPFRPYPGFAVYPYPGYSRPFFTGEYRVLRGASRAAPPSLARPTYRNWDRPERRRLFAGLRLAWGDR
ncbi:MAG: ergothioneine biosynthesis protein EgtB [Acidobacteria bacterium]|nr:MAG: ergothioneine biosynthesis protein EgtB [Acidobacteriota bacterium]